MKTTGTEQRTQTHGYDHLIFDKVTKNMMEKRQPLQMLLGKLDICLQKMETRSMFVCTSIIQGTDLPEYTGNSKN
jgi:hypothetical protein